jgi:hypothetical protein
MARKTIDVESIKVWTNEKLANDSYSDEEKYGMMNTLDHILNETGNYKGFGYLDKYNVDTWNKHNDMRRYYI